MTQMKNQMNNASAKSNLVSLGRVQVPAKNGNHILYKHADSTDLDSMIGDLESDMNRHGVDTTTKGDCGACGRPIVGQVVAALGKMYHPEHFTCAKCNTELGSLSFFEREGLAYCEDDYHRLFSPKCNYCNQAILDVSSPVLCLLLTLLTSQLTVSFLSIAMHHRPRQNLASRALFLCPLQQELW